MKFFVAAALTFSVASFFSVAQAGSFPRVRIFNPKQNDIWFEGEARNIVWKLASLPPPPNPLSLNITLRRKSDPSFAYHIVRDAPTGALQYAWKVPSGLPNANDYVLYLVPNRLFPEVGRPNIMASKSKPFTIVSKAAPANSITILQPLNQAVWYGGQSRFIEWKFSGTQTGAVTSIFIRDIKNKVVGYPYPYQIAGALPTGATHSELVKFKWTVPYEFRTSDGYQISVVATYPNTTIPPVIAVMTENFKIVQVGDAGHGQPTPITISFVQATPVAN